MSVCKWYIIKYNITFKRRDINCIGFIFNGGFRIQKFIQSFLWSSTTLNHTCRPPKCHHREGKEVYINNKLGNGTCTNSGRVTRSVIPPTYCNSQYSTDANQQCHWRKINGFHFCKTDGVLFIEIAILIKEKHHCFFLYKRFNYPDARITFLCCCCQSWKQCLDAFALFIDNCIDRINCYGENR